MFLELACHRGALDIHVVSQLIVLPIISMSKRDDPVATDGVLCMFSVVDQRAHACLRARNLEHVTRTWVNERPHEIKDIAPPTAVMITHPRLDAKKKRMDLKKKYGAKRLHSVSETATND